MSGKLDAIPPLTAQDANRALGLPEDAVGIWIEHRLDTARRRWQVRRRDGGEWHDVESGAGQ